MGMANGSPIIETNRLQLRLFEQADVEQLYLLYSDPEVMRYMRGTRDRKQAEEHIQAFAQQYAKTGFTLWAVEQKTDGQFIGRVGLFHLDGTQEVELGYVIARPHWGRGLATEASVACLDFGFRQLALEFITAIAVPENVASLRVMKKLGFKFVREDRFYDMDVLYHRLEREEWLAANPTRFMQIRRATIEDARAISDLIRPLAERYIAYESSSEGAVNLLASLEAEAIERYLTSGYEYHVAEEDGVLVGVVGVRDNSHLYHLFVADDFRGRGLARQLWQVSRNACRQAGNIGEFTVNSSQFAVGMYRKFGFVETGPPETKSGVTSTPMKLVDAT